MDEITNVLAGFYASTYPQLNRDKILKVLKEALP
jgi:hypothetical protein